MIFRKFSKEWGRGFPDLLVSQTSEMGNLTRKEGTFGRLNFFGKIYYECRHFPENLQYIIIHIARMKGREGWWGGQNLISKNPSIFVRQVVLVKKKIKNSLT